MSGIMGPFVIPAELWRNYFLRRVPNPHTPATDNLKEVLEVARQAELQDKNSQYYKAYSAEQAKKERMRAARANHIRNDPFFKACEAAEKKL
ncbi:hypothetical protein [Methanoplanus limicola]|uniref:Uncharacterized protein n=1 Tax=Methanoplanus limicola DSM 2279 TaxID=937775 RepID=H1Z3M7_9EURY|nr:hypothetical protein [Methanoplanus limicola]EHQ35626.1 hypothetical protein Metlim_1525 [Methanoplanus limicola DSM 2279]